MVCKQYTQFFSRSFFSWFAILNLVCGFKSSAAAKAVKLTPMLGMFEGRRGVKNLDGYQIFFNGCKAKTDSAGRFQFQSDLLPTETEPLYLLISGGVQWSCKPNSKTVRQACHDAKLPYKFYSIYRVADAEQNSSQLEVREESLESRNYQIPIERCFIAPINPYFVCEVRPPRIVEQAGIFNLPKIVLQNEAVLQQSKADFLAAKNCPAEIIEYKVKKIIFRGRDKGTIRSLEELSWHEPQVQKTRTVKNRKGVMVNLSF